MGNQELQVSFDEVREKNVEQLKMLNNIVFPIKFPDSVYKDCLQFPDMTQMAYHNDVAVGGVAARCEKQASGRVRCYIATLAVLAPYRSYGIGARLLAKVVAAASADANIDEVAVHVQADNEEARKFYERHGFAVVETVKDYYKRLECTDALLLAKKLA
eukprot:CAMPEP_0202868476 /NCGR_PEP_ID=MMETSP1391-20130828/10900_1 /ASSEMBLY_ACC=CAM_ASM_000867 /TAXON_ID=1034604 /ORGANISM="Chlamydomonas leiostraca, Strain SAG 11-49" /LENGTH=158 /DNA_ID=CAMNT_0049548651 /DNA_START=63 /DNA_END=535 /DNA_ORIENTATION=+